MNNMKPEIKKIYKKLSKNSNIDIAQEASLQLKFESGNNSELQKKEARLKSMVDLSSMMLYEKRKNDKNIEEIVEATFISSFNTLQDTKE